MTEVIKLETIKIITIEIITSILIGVTIQKMIKDILNQKTEKL